MILDALPLSGVKFALALVSKTWRAAMLLPCSHVSSRQAPQDMQKVDVYDVAPLEVVQLLPRAQGPFFDRRLAAGGHEHIRAILVLDAPAWEWPTKFVSVKTLALDQKH